MFFKKPKNEKKGNKSALNRRTFLLGAGAVALTITADNAGATEEGPLSSFNRQCTARLPRQAERRRPLHFCQALDGRVLSGTDESELTSEERAIAERVRANNPEMRQDLPLAAYLPSPIASITKAFTAYTLAAMAKEHQLGMGNQFHSACVSRCRSRRSRRRYANWNVTEGTHYMLERSSNSFAYALAAFAGIRLNNQWAAGNRVAVGSAADFDNTAREAVWQKFQRSRTNFNAFMTRMNREIGRFMSKEAVFFNPHGLPGYETNVAGMPGGRGGRMTTSEENRACTADIAAGWRAIYELGREEIIDINGIRLDLLNQFRTIVIDGGIPITIYFKTGTACAVGHAISGVAVRADGEVLTCVTVGNANIEDRGHHFFDTIREGFRQIDIAAGRTPRDHNAGGDPNLPDDETPDPADEEAMQEDIANGDIEGTATIPPAGAPLGPRPDRAPPVTSELNGPF